LLTFVWKFDEADDEAHEEFEREVGGGGDDDVDGGVDGGGGGWNVFICSQNLDGNFTVLPKPPIFYALWVATTSSVCLKGWGYGGYRL
jgi:hypothetical protein